MLPHTVQDIGHDANKLDIDEQKVFKPDNTEFDLFLRGHLLKLQSPVCGGGGNFSA